MSEFHDPDLRNQLGQLSGPYPDDNEAFAAWQRRVGQARRRRAVAWTTGAALSLLFGTVAVAALKSPGRDTLVPSKAGDSTEVTISTTTEPDESTTVPTTEPSTTDSTIADTTPATAVVDTSVPVTEVEATDVAGDGGGANSGPGKQHTPTSAAATPASNTETFSSPGGSIAVQQNGDQLKIVKITPVGGFDWKEDESSGRRVEATFKSNNQEFQISVRVVDGKMKPNIDEKPRKHDNSNTVPENTDTESHNSSNESGDN